MTNGISANAQTPELVVDTGGMGADLIQSLDISDDGQLLAVATGKLVRVWNINSGRVFATLRGYQEAGGFGIGHINRVRFLPGTRYLGVALSDNIKSIGSTRIYNLANTDRIDHTVAGHAGCTRQLEFSPSATRMVTHGCDGNLIFYEKDRSTGRWGKTFGLPLKSHKTLQASEFGLSNTSSYIGFPYDDQWFVWSGGTDLYCVNAATNQSATTASELPSGLRTAIRRFSGAADFSIPNSNKLLLKGYRNGQLTVAWNESSGGRTNFFGGIVTQTDQVKRFAASDTVIVTTHKPRVSLAAFATQTGEVTVWNTNNSARPILKLRSSAVQLWGVQWSSDGSRILFSDRNYSNSEGYNFNRFGPLNRAFDLKTNQVVLNAKGKDSPVEQKGFDRSVGKQISFRPVRGSSLSSQTDLAINDPLAFVFAAKVEGVDSGHQRALNPWVNMTMRDLPASRVLDDRHFGQVYSYKTVKLASGDLSVLVGTQKGALQQYRIRWFDGKPTLELLRSFVGHQDRVTGISVSSDGERLASCSLDGTIRIWKFGEPRSLPSIDFVVDGTKVIHVPANSSANSAGFQPNDVIYTLDGEPFFERFQNTARGKYQIGQKVMLTGGRPDNDYAPMSGEVQLVDGQDIVEPLNTLFLAGDPERPESRSPEDYQWVLYTPDGFFDASPKGDSLIGFHVNRARQETALYFGVGQYRKLERPDLVRKARSIGEGALIAAQVAKPTDQVDLANTRPPRVHLVSPTDQTVVSRNASTAIIEVLSSNPIPDRAVSVRVNGGPAEKKFTAERSSSAGEHKMVIKQPIKLVVGQNTIAVKVSGRGDTVASESWRIEYESSAAEKKTQRPDLILLAIGVSDYKNDDYDLLYAAKDARDFAVAWKSQQGKAFASVETKVLADDVSVKDVKDGIRWLQTQTELRANANPGAKPIAMLLLAGHGVYDEYDDWFFATQELEQEDLDSTAVALTDFGKWMQRIPGTIITFIDSCHSGELGGISDLRTRPRREKDIWRHNEYFVFASCDHDQYSLEADEWENGAFVESVLQTLSRPDQSIVTDSTMDMGEFELLVKRRLNKLTDGQQAAKVYDENDLSDMIVWLNSQSRSGQTGIARVRKAPKTPKPSMITPPRVTPAPRPVTPRPTSPSSTTKKYVSTFRNRVGCEMKLIPAGSFMMGSRDSIQQILNEFTGEGAQAHQPSFPRRQIRISKQFYMSRHEVTLGQFRRFVNATNYVTTAEAGRSAGNPLPIDRLQQPVTWRSSGNGANGENFPVTVVSWEDCQAFCKWLSRQEGRKVRLPTQAEWEYACRAGGNGRFSFGDNPEFLARYANVPNRRYSGKSITESILADDGYQGVAPVGNYLPNAFGLFDMHGNVWEWCQDGFDLNYANCNAVDPVGSLFTDMYAIRGACFL